MSDVWQILGLDSYLLKGKIYYTIEICLSIVCVYIEIYAIKYVYLYLLVFQLSLNSEE